LGPLSRFIHYIEIVCGISMTRVMATGVFDILHPGHIHFLQEAAKNGDELVVVVARDETAKKNGKQLLFDERTRLMMISQLRIVNRAVLGAIGDIYTTVEQVKPDIIALGYDQKFDPAEIVRKCSERGIQVRVLRMSRSNHDGPPSTTEIKRKLISEIQNRF
jgi:FAD synthetase